jgi:hypothetical protein
MADDDESIDPRFDPAFQRGFEGTVGVTPRRPPVGTPSVLPAQQTVRPTASSPAAARPPVPSYATQPVATEHEPLETSFDQAEAEPAQPRRLNPYVIALAVIGVVFIVAGIAGAQFANGVYASDTLTSAVSFSTVLLVISGSAVSIGLGVATLIGIVFLFALRYRR